MENKLVAGIVATAIAVIVLAGVLMPALDDATAVNEKFTNDGYFRMNKITDGTITFRWDYDDPTKITVNDEIIEYSNNNNLEISVVCSESFYLRIRNNNASFIYNGPGGNLVADNTGEYILLTLTSNSGTVTNGDTSYTVTNTGDIYHISNIGDYSMKKSNEPAYMNADSQIFNRGVTRVNTHYVSFVVEGSIEDGPTITASNVEISNATMNAVKIDEYLDLYKFNSLTFDATYTGEEGTTNVTYNYVVVPYEVTSEKTVHLDPAMNTILSVIPILIIVAVLLGVVAIFIARRE